MRLDICAHCAIATAWIPSPHCFLNHQARVLLKVLEHLLGVVSAAAEAEAVEMVRVGTTGGECSAISPAEPAGWSGSDTVLFDVEEELAGESDSVLRKIFD